MAIKFTYDYWRGGRSPKFDTFKDAKYAAPRTPEVDKLVAQEGSFNILKYDGTRRLGYYQCKLVRMGTAVSSKPRYHTKCKKFRSDED